MPSFNHKHSTIESGDAGESLVCNRLSRRGFTIVDRNIRYKFAEIDIVARDADTLVFIEVRTRTDTTLGHPAETVSYKKQTHIRKAAQMYLAQNDINDVPIRFDVATIIWKSMKMEYFENAF